MSPLVERDDLDFSSATATSQLFYFRNGAVLVTADKLTRLQPSQSANGHYVWENAVIQHDFRDMKPQFTETKDDKGNLHIAISPDAKSKLLRFLVNTSRLYWRKKDEQKIDLTPEEIAEEELSLIVKILNIGYMLHRYKSSSEAKATLCLDHAMSDRDDACNGRSGKSFYIHALTEIMVNFFEIDGRTMDSKTNMQFIYAGMDETTSFIKVDECSKDFNFEYFFGQITNNITVEKKGKDPVTIPFNKAPKFIFGTNYVLKKHDPSTDARIWPVIFSDYYHKQYKIKIIVVGDSGVGKTNLINRFASDKFDTNSKATIGVEFVYKTLKINKEVIKVEVWDTAGQERYRAITSSYYKGAKGAIIVYDITNEDSFNNVESWMNEVTKKGKTDMQFLLVGNKKDLINDRKVTEQKGIDKAKELNMNLFEASALEKTNVNEAFNYLVKEIYLNIRKEKNIITNNDEKIGQGGIALNTNKKKRKKCC